MSYLNSIRGFLVSFVTLVVALSLLPAAALAQPSSDGNLAQIVFVTPKDGHGHDFEEGLKRHAEATGGPYAWLTWEIMTGDRTGSYMAGTFGHSWADFDMQPDDPMRAEMSFRTNIQPHVQDAQVSFWMFRPELSTTAPEEGGTPSRFTQVYHYMPKVSGGQTAEQAFARVKEAADAAMWPGEWMVYSLVNGGQLPHYVIVIEADSFADFAEPEPTMYEMLVGQMGEDEAIALFQSFAEAMMSENSEMHAFREDLSYFPEGGM